MENNENDNTPAERPTSSSGTTGPSAELSPSSSLLALVGHVQALEARIATLEGRNGGLQDQISGLHSAHADVATVVGQHEESLDELHALLGQIHAAVVPSGPKPMRGREDERRPPGAAPGLQVGAPAFTPEGRETALLVDPTTPGTHRTTLPGGQEVEINVRNKPAPQPGGMIRDGQLTTRAVRRR